MAQTETIREFLVKLGFVSDEAGLKKFEDGIGKATKSVLALSAAVTAMATTVAIGVERFAARLEGLYFSASRVGTTVQNLTAFQRAAQNFGVSAEEAGGSLEGLATALLNPALKGGLTALLERGGFKLDKDNITNLINLGKVLSTMQPIYAQQYLKMFGLPTDLAFLKMIQNPALLGEFAKFQRLTVGSDKTAADAHRFMESFRTFTAEVQKFGLQIYDVLEKKLGLSLDKLTAWLDKNGQRIATELVAGIRELWDWITNRLIPTLEKWYTEWDKLNTRFDGWPNKIALVVGALKLFGGTGIISGIASLTGGILSLGAALIGVGGGAATALGLITKLSTIAAAAFVAYEGFKSYTETQELAKTSPGVTTPAAQGVEGWLANLLPESMRTKFLADASARDAQRAKTFGPASVNQPLTQAATNAAALSSAPPVDALNRPLTSTAASLAALLGVDERGSGTTVNQNITINVNGSKSPGDAAREIKRSLQNATGNALQAGGGR